MPLNIPTLKRKPNDDDDVLTRQRDEAMLHMARLAHERMKRIDEEDHERGMKEQQYNNSVKYQRMVEYELNNPGETATVRPEQPFLAPRYAYTSLKITYDREYSNTKQSLGDRGGDGSSGGY